MIKFLKDLSPNNLNQKTCLLRVDLNIQSAEKDSLRLEAVIPTLQHLQRYNATTIILSHRGRPLTPQTNADITQKNADFPPKSTFSPRHSALTLKPFAKILSKKIKKEVQFANALTKKPKNQKTIILLENLRFDPREEKNDREFAKKLASLGDIYINDAFSVSHRENASITAIPKYLPSYGGMLMEKEIRSLDKAMKRYKSPLTLILGGVKIKDKAGVLSYFKNKAKHILIGGAVANIFLKKDPSIRKFSSYKNIILPDDTRGKNMEDIGSKTIKKFTAIISKSKTIIWNGPMGKFENKKYGAGTKAIWRAILANKKAFSVIGGGETVASAKLISNFEFRISNLRNVFISTGGGAMLEYLSGKKLPGIEALNKKKL